MNGTPLKVLLVARQPSLLVSLSKVLDLLGFVALQAADARQAAAAEPPDLLILDSELLPHGGRELCRTACGGETRNHVFTLLLVDQSAPASETVEALKLGVDDFLLKPIVFGELLARLRAAARGLEYERRMQAYLGTDPHFGLPNANAFRQALRAALEGRERGGAISVVAVDLDFFYRLNYMYGRPEADELLRSVAKLLDGACAPTEVAAAAGDDKFWVLLPDRTEREAAAWAERFRATLTDTPLTVGGTSEVLTASFGVAGTSNPGVSAADLLARADEALQAAKRSGRNCVVERASLDDEANAWTNLGAPGKLFDRTVARDVMTPCTVVLRPEELAAEAAAIARRMGLAALPVVDGDGHLTGLVTIEELAVRRDDVERGARVADVMLPEPPRFADETNFGELVKFFSAFERSMAVVVDGDAPVGIVTRNGLAALSETLCAESFSATTDDEASSDSLVVPDATSRR